MRLPIIISLCFVWLACAPQYSGKQPPKVVNGEIDLTGWDFEKDGPVKLDGNWLFAWEKFVEPGSWDNLKQEMIHQVMIPSQWQDLKDPANPYQNLPGTGYASYALKVKGLKEKAFDFKSDVTNAGSTYLLNKNGKTLYLVHEGQASINPEKEISTSHSTSVFSWRLVEQTAMDEILFLIHHSNFQLSYARVAAPVLSHAGYLVNKQLSAKNQKAMMFGILLIIGIYHLMLFFQRATDKSVLFFGFLCLSVALRQFVTGVAQDAGLSESKKAFELIIRLDYGSLIISLLSAVFYCKYFMAGKFLDSIARFMVLMASLLLIFTFFSDIYSLSAALNTFILYIMICFTSLSIHLLYATFKGRADSRLLLTSFLLVFLGAVNDILFTKGYISTGFLAPFTMTGFLLLQAGLIARRAGKDYKTAQYLSNKLSEEVAAQTKKLNRIQFLSQQIQNTSDLDTMIKNLNKVLEQEFGVPGYVFFLLNKEKNALDVLKIESIYEVSVDVKEIMYQTPFLLSHPKSLHGAVVKKRKPYFLTRLLDIENAPDEIKIRELTGMKSLFLLPLKIDGEVFAALSMSDTKFQEEDRIKFFTREERAELVQLSEFVSSALYQALQKEEIQKAQDAASRAKNEAAINQLAAHLAHEVNNPLNYIATGKTIQSDSFEKYHNLILGVLTGDDKDSLAFKEELEKLQDKFNLGLEQTKNGQNRIAKVIAEIRAITGIDGLQMVNFDLAPLIYEELLYSLHRNQITEDNLKVTVTGTEQPLQVLSNTYILARSVRTIISNCIHFARKDQAEEGEIFIDCRHTDSAVLIDIGNNSNSIKTKKLSDLFDLEKAQAYGTEQIGLGMIKELLHKIDADLVLADHGRESGKVVFQLQVPLES